MNKYYWDISIGKHQNYKSDRVKLDDRSISIITPKIKSIDKNIIFDIENDKIWLCYRNIEIKIFSHSDEWFTINFSINGGNSFILCDQLEGLVKFLDIRRYNNQIATRFNKSKHKNRIKKVFI